MMRRLLVLNIVLAAVLVAMAVRFHNDWRNFESTHQIAAIQPESEAAPNIAAPATPNAGTPEDWTDIPSHNLFSFDRTDIPILEPTAPPKPPGTKPILFGTVSLGKEPLAMVASGQPPGNRNYRPMKIGEVIDGWTITKILDKSITIKADDVEQSVLMNDPSAQVPRDATRTTAAAAPVVSTSQPQPAPSALTASPLSAPPPQSTASPPRGRRRILQQTPFGVREIEVDE
jgi:hypothetical protein